MIIGRSNTRTVTCPEHMAKVYHAALTVALEALAKVPNSATTAMVLADLQVGFADMGEPRDTLEGRLGQLRAAQAQAKPAAPDPLEERKRLVLGNLYRLDESDCGWWVCDAVDGAAIMGPHPTPEAALDAWSGHESRPAE